MKLRLSSIVLLVVVPVILFISTTTTTAFSITKINNNRITSFATTTTTTTTVKMSSSLKPYLETLIAGERHLTSEETKAAFGAILQGADAVQVGSFLTLLRARGENPDEIAGAVEAMNEACNSVDLEGRKLLDIVGTGGDGADTINISTASVVLAAACGCVVAKAGNRSVSSACGSADVLEALGVTVDLAPAEIIKCVDKIGVAFMFAPVNHPAMRFVAPVRAKLGVRTVFNILGPMTNAAGAQRAVIGVFHPELLELMAGALKRVGRVDHAVIIHGVGLDEISPLGPATLVEIKNTASVGEPKVYDTKTFEFDPLSVGIPRCVVGDLKGGGPKENADAFKEVLQGGSHTNAKRDSIVLNAGVGNYIYGLEGCTTIEAGIQKARTTLEAGTAATLLEKWITVSQDIGKASSAKAKEAEATKAEAPKAKTSIGFK
mmetsp:Transcript_34238/g.36999  ORF Transcript_34238/g.36999 Transcript_34238/m.36999 type:complete len:434 (-) Transcript_34238:201-1502(-)